MPWYQGHDLILRCAATIKLESGTHLKKFVTLTPVHTPMHTFRSCGVSKYTDQHKRKPTTLMVSISCHLMSVQVLIGLHLSACLNTETYSDCSHASPFMVSFPLSAYMKGCVPLHFHTDCLCFHCHHNGL